AEIHRGGWFGKVQRYGHEGTSNIGTFGDNADRCAGLATNIVTDYVLIRGESRSHDARFVSTITRAYRDAFRAAAAQVVDDRGRPARIRFQARRDYYPFRLKPTSPVVRHAVAAAQRAGFQPKLRVTNGGLDANWLVRHGVPTITFGAGQNQVHTVEEYVYVKEVLNGCRMALALATANDEA